VEDPGRSLRPGAGRRIVAALHGSLHAEARQLAQPSGNRNQPARPPMSGKAADSKSEVSQGRMPRLEPTNQSRSNHHTLEIHPSRRPPGLPLSTQSFHAVTALAGTNSAFAPFFSPDGQSVAFFSLG